MRLLIWLAAALWMVLTPVQMFAQSEPVEEVAVQTLPMVNDLLRQGREYSGMAWYGDALALLPQWDDLIILIEHDDLLAGLVDGTEMNGRRIPIEWDELTIIDGTQGFEAVVFDGDTVYLTIEALSGGRMQSYLVRGTMDLDEYRVLLESDSLTSIPQRGLLYNAAHEALMLYDERLYAIYERNLPARAVWTSDLAMDDASFLPFVDMPYRVTDATDVDDDGRFWVINYRFPRETIPMHNDPYGVGGDSHALQPQVERLIELQISDNRIRLTDTPPIYLQLSDEPRNWEGIVQWEGYGFLIVTDKFPESILGFVPYVVPDDGS